MSGSEATSNDQPSARAATLAERFDQLRGEVEAFVRACPPERWRTVTDSEGWPLALVVHHVALAFALQAAWVRSMARGEGVPTSMEEIHTGNAERRDAADAQPDAYAPEIILALLAENGQVASATVRALTDAQLQASAYFGPADRPLTTEQVVKAALLAHARDHLASMRSSLDQARG